jgi:hypothetical protein
MLLAIRMAAHEGPVRRRHTAEVLGPRPVDGAVDHRVADLLRPQLLGDGRKTEKRVDLPFRQQLDGLGDRVRHEVDILMGVQAHVGRHAGEEDVLGAPQLDHRHGLALEVSDRADTVGPEQLEATDVDAGENDERIAGIDPDDDGTAVVHADVSLTCRQCHHARAPTCLPDILDVGEALPTQELVGDVLRRPADARDLDEANPAGLGWRLGSDRPGV